MCGRVTASYGPCIKTVLNSNHKVDIYLGITIWKQYHKIRLTGDKIRMHVMLHKWKKLIISSSTFETTRMRSIFICYWAILYGLGLYSCHIKAFSTKAHWLLLVQISRPNSYLYIFPTVNFGSALFSDSAAI